MLSGNAKSLRVVFLYFDAILLQTTMVTLDTIAAKTPNGFAKSMYLGIARTQTKAMKRVLTKNGPKLFFFCSFL